MDSKNIGVNTIKEGFSDEICGTRARVVCRGNVSVEARLTILQSY